MGDIVIKGRILGHSVSEIHANGLVSYTGVEFEKDDGEVIWLKNAAMLSRCHYLFQKALDHDDRVTLWLHGGRKGSWLYGVTLGDRYAYELPPRGGLFFGGFFFLALGIMTIATWIGIPIALLGLGALIQTFLFAPRHSAREVKAGEIEVKAKGYGIEALAETRARRRVAA